MAKVAIAFARVEPSSSRFSTLVARNVRGAILALCAATGFVASIDAGHAQAPTVMNQFIYRDFRGTNDLFIPSGDQLVVGGLVSGGSATTSIQVQFVSNTPTGSFTNPTGPCNPFPANLNYCDRSIPFSTARLNGTWNLKFTNASGSTTVTTPPSPPIPNSVIPFPTDVQTSADSSGTPSIKWKVPAGASVDIVRVLVFDKSQTIATGQSANIEFKNLDPSVTSYVPTSALTNGGNYAFGIQFIKTRTVVSPAAILNKDILTSSSSYFSFTKTAGAAPPAELPQVAANGVYNFTVSSVSPTAETNLDPPVAIGFNYATGPSDPNFSTVKLPNIGGGNFMVSYKDGSGKVVAQSLAAGTEMSFPAGGVTNFSVRGIDPAAKIDPTNAGLFVTTVKFAKTGGFSGSMTPVTDANTLFASTLPSSRSVQVGNSATAFATILNIGTANLTGCTIRPAQTLLANFTYQTTNSQTNALTGTPNTPVPIPAGGSQSFVIAFTPTAAFAPIDVPLGFSCQSSGEIVPSIVGVNTILLTADTNPVPDIIALAATASNDGIVNIPGANGTGAFAVASINIGSGGAVSVSADFGAASVSANITLCQSNPSTGACLAPPAGAILSTINTNDTPTFSVFVAGTGTVPFDAAVNRVFLRFKDGGGVTRGATSVAVRTQ